MEATLKNLMQALPTLLQENESGVLAETEITFTPFQAIERSKSAVHWLFRPDQTGGTGAAIIRYEPGGESPPHLHTGFELAYVLEGEMITSQGSVKKNEMMLLTPGSRHSSRSGEAGCLALIIWEKPPQPIEE
ncbi:cupin domain-containing protein [Baia soyae]|uniref:ChrR-like anti-ECFsigma factor n=1 Tax=Baia soyae TaxID=1544746 RepID=A0A4R2RQV4_9BACL|nr:cupin domain-containing protein [Baia soyae]TCP66540.1 ChrR-like anti-ECFsigma factor [Baia soyae]